VLLHLTVVVAAPTLAPPDTTAAAACISFRDAISVTVAAAVAAVDKLPTWLGAAVAPGVDGDSQGDNGPNE